MTSLSGWEHKNGITGGFTKKYNVHKLVYYELFEDMESAILAVDLYQQPLVA